jgi:hypothetical protein
MHWHISVIRALCATTLLRANTQSICSLCHQSSYSVLVLLLTLLAAHCTLLHNFACTNTHTHHRSYNPNSGDTGGLVLDDWKTPNTVKLALIAKLQSNPSVFTALSAGNVCVEYGSANCAGNVQSAPIVAQPPVAVQQPVAPVVNTNTGGVAGATCSNGLPHADGIACCPKSCGSVCEYLTFFSLQQPVL